MSGKKEEEQGQRRPGIGTRLIGWFTDPDEPPEGDEHTAEPRAAPTMSAGLGFSNVPSGAVSMVAQADAETVQELNEALVQRPGYAKLLKRLDKLSTIIPDEGTRLKAALSMLEEDGFTRDALLLELDACKGILDDKKKSFGDDAQRQLDATAGQKTLQITQNAEKVARNRADIERLTAEISQLEGQSAMLTSQVEHDKEAVRRGIAVYEASDESVRRTIEAVRSKVASSD